MSKTTLTSVVLFCVLGVLSCPVFAFSDDSSELSIVYGHENNALSQVFENFTKQTSIPIRSRSIDNSELKAELLQRADRNELPDAVLVPADFLGLQQIKYSQVPVELLNKDSGERFKQTTLISGKHRGIPVIAGNHLLLYYNKALITEAATYWQQLLEQKSSLSAQTQLIAWSFHEMYWFIPFLTAFGGMPILDLEANLDTQAMQQALEFYWFLSRDRQVNSECDYSCSKTTFEQGHQAYLISGFWSYASLLENMGDNLGVAALPMIEGKPMISYFSSHVLAFPDNSLAGAKGAKLKKLAKYLQSQNVQQAIWDEMRSLPVNQPILANIAAQPDHNMKIVISQLNQAIPMPSSFVMAIVWEAIGKGFKRYGAGILDAQQASKLMQHLAEKSIQFKQQDD